MNIKEIYECSYCQETFDTEKKATKHEIKCLKFVTNKKEKEIKLKKWQEKFENTTSIKEVECLLVDYAKDMYDVKITVTLDVKFREQISNSHGHPRNGKENWNRKKENVPLGYPGWTGSKITIPAIYKRKAYH